MLVCLFVYLFVCCLKVCRKIKKLLWALTVFTFLSLLSLCTHYQPLTVTSILSNQVWVIIFYVSVGIGLFGNHIMFYGDSLYNKGFDTLVSTLTTIENMITSVRTDSDAIKVINTILSEYMCLECPIFSSMV